MKKIGLFLNNKKIKEKVPLDSNSIYYVFSKIIKDEYGNRGVENLKAEHFKEKKLFIKAENSNWASEVWLNRNSIVEKINKELGSNEINEISVGKWKSTEEYLPLNRFYDKSNKYKYFINAIYSKNKFN